MNVNELKVGTKLELELINSVGEKIGQPYVSQLMDIVAKDTVVIAAPIHESRLMLITNGTRVRVVFLHEKFGLLSFKGFIIGKEKSGTMVSLLVKIDGSFERIQRRKYFRLDTNLNAQYAPHEGNKKDPDDAKKDYKKTLTRNLSGSGACIISNEEISKNSLLEVLIWLDSQTQVKVICKVVRCSPLENIRDKRFEIGLYFSEISQRDQDTIIKFIFNQQRLLLKNKPVN